MFSERLSSLLDHFHLSIHAFEASIGVGNGTVRKAVKEGKGLGSEAVEKIFANFPQVNFDWLITGRGDMLVGGNSLSTITKNFPKKNGNLVDLKNRTSGEQISIPILDAMASAGDPFIFDHPDFYRNLDSFILPKSLFRNGVFGSIQVRGDSMAETLQPGDYVIGKELPTMDEFRNGEIYIVIFQEDQKILFLVKRCYYYVGDEKIQLVSDNPYHSPHEEHILITAILKIYQVQARLTTFLERGGLASKVHSIEKQLEMLIKKQ
jgi:phage repressor protein C with HTH and peptisase S24 domain